MNKLITFLTIISLSLTVNAQESEIPVISPDNPLANNPENIDPGYDHVLGIPNMPQSGIDFDSLNLGGSDFDLGSLSSGFGGGSKSSEVNELCSPKKGLKKKGDIRRILKEKKIGIGSMFSKISHQSKQPCIAKFNRFKEKDKVLTCQCRSLVTYALFKKDTEKCIGNTRLVNSSANDYESQNMMSSCMSNIGWGDSSNWANNVDNEYYFSE